MGICFGTGPNGHFYWSDDVPCPWPRQGRALRRLRMMRGWSLRKLATTLGSCISRVSSLERGMAEISADERRLLACGDAEKG